MSEVLQEVETGVGVRYVVKIDGVDLGSFSSCTGLGVEVVMEVREEGGNNTNAWQLPTRLKYPNITLTRPLGKDTSKVAEWFSSVAKGYKRRTGTIEAMTVDGRIIATWGLTDIVPVRWSGPTFNSDSPAILTESVEIAHHGFLAP
ncbi:phage tail protein [Occultella glacieicola]|uniref:Phage tail protein n=1 Tax=Occultella glacieicola TaxID=2518684 RepID=A0ABY2E8F0_9MICO|nr:phage tail protein [Occultella glacieicola]TDE98778.1 phage tail protein [Occultella glacieicola]